MTTIDTIRAKVVLGLYRGGKAAFGHLAEFLGMELVSVSPCLAPLRRQGFVYDTGERINERSKSDCVVWDLTDAGRELALHLVRQEDGE